jgi:predicted GIY-YIG superfamily endonuclease
MPFSDPRTYDFTSTVWKPVAAVYGIMNSKKQMIYVGQTDDLQRRMDEHRNDSAHCMYRYGPALVTVEVLSGGEAIRRDRELRLIAEYSPPCNG